MGLRAEEPPDFAHRLIAAAPIGVAYNGAYCPPGQSNTWRMDCSNTVRCIYGTAAGLSLPRTASDQYLYLKNRHRLKSANRDPRHLAKVLRTGDLLFWENTYKPVRRPPITHVMVYLGKDSRGRMIMVGSQGSRGVAIYQFKPQQEWGGYRWFFFFKRPGRFVAYGRPM